MHNINVHVMNIVTTEPIYYDLLLSHVCCLLLVGIFLELESSDSLPTVKYLCKCAMKLTINTAQYIATWCNKQQLNQMVAINTMLLLYSAPKTSPSSSSSSNHVLVMISSNMNPSYLHNRQVNAQHVIVIFELTYMFV